MFTDAIVKTLLNEETDELEGVFYPRREWQRLFQLFPEVVFVDATHKLNCVGMPLYIMMGLDGNGDTFLVFLGFVKNETLPVMRKMLKKFFDNNPVSPKAFMADKDWIERTVIAEFFPNSHILVCLFHTLRTFKREVKSKAMNCTEGEKVSYIEICKAWRMQPAIGLC